MQYTLSLTQRMVTIAGICLVLLCVLLFFLGIEIGKRMAEPVPAVLPGIPSASPEIPKPLTPSEAASSPITSKP